jgi:hypothetical protein
MRARQTTDVAEEMGEQRAGLDVMLVDGSIDLDFDEAVHGIDSVRGLRRWWRQAMATA